MNVAVSCGSGTREDHVAVDQVVPDCQLVVTGVVNVIPEFHPQSQLFHVIADRFQEPAHAHVMSWKSAFDAVTVAAVMVRAVPIVLDATFVLLTDEFQLTEKVQLTTILFAKTNEFTLFVLHVIVKLLNVLVHDMFDATWFVCSTL